MASGTARTGYAPFIDSVQLEPFFAFNDAPVTTDTVLVAGIAGKKIRVTAYTLTGGTAASTVVFNSKGSGAGTAASSVKSLAISGTVHAAHNPGGHFESTNVGEGISITVTGATVGVDLTYVVLG